MHDRSSLGLGLGSAVLRCQLPLLIALSCAGCIQREPKEAGVSAAAPGGNGSSAVSDASARTALLGAGGPREFALQGATEKVELGLVPVSDQSFKEALRLKIKEASGSTWSVQAQAKISAPVSKGDAILATFYVRSIEPQSDGKTETEFVFERGTGPYTKSITYSVFATPEWRKVQIRFASKESYAAGEAQMIFRLGYEPQLLEVGGVTVENFGKVKVRALPSTEVADLKSRPKPIREAPLPATDGGELAFTVSAGSQLGKISPYVYGINSQRFAETGTTLRRMGGNRQTVYNWELNASNAGNDFRHQNDDWPCTVMGYRNCDQPAAQLIDFVRENQKQGVESLLVLPLVDYVSADKGGPVEEADKAPSRRFLRSEPAKPGPFADKPNLADGVVYQDELVSYLGKSLGKAGQGGARFYALDNEPALWPSTHPRVHPKPTTYAEIVKRSEAMAAALTKLDPGAQVLGAVAFGWSEYMSLSSAPDAEEYNKKHGTYLDFFLASMRALEQKHGRRLVHALDIHWYPELRGTSRITENDASRKTVAARLQAPRSLWDPTFQEKTWIGDQLGKPIRLFPWLKERIAANYPGTELAFTEYNFGAGDHISGGLAQVDVLGILGREGVLLANYWGNGPGNGDLPPFIIAAFKLFRNYDGKGGRFGDVAVRAESAQPAVATIYAATPSGKAGATLLIVNQDQQRNFAGKISVSGASCTSARPFRFDASSPKLQALPKVLPQGGVISHPLPRLSATLFVCE